MTTTTSNPTRKASEIGFGIEIECNIPTTHRSSFPVGSYHRGAPVNVDGLSTWNTQADGSVHTFATDMFSAEVVSPVLRGEDGLRQVVTMLDYLAAIGATVNASCGLHVHVDTANLTPDQMKRLVRLFKTFEVAYYDLNGQNTSARINSTYCAPASRWNGTRYQSLNMQHATENQPHIEIRVWQGAMKPETVVSAIYMAVALVSRVTDSKVVKTSDIRRNDPKQVMAKYINRFMSPDCMIVSDERPDDIWTEMMREAGNSNRNR